jgi:hypothetical protein
MPFACFFLATVHVLLCLNHDLITVLTIESGGTEASNTIDEASGVHGGGRILGQPQCCGGCDLPLRAFPSLRRFPLGMGVRSTYGHSLPLRQRAVIALRQH